jgi:hypothetical protein
MVAFAAVTDVRWRLISRLATGAKTERHRTPRISPARSNANKG